MKKIAILLAMVLFAGLQVMWAQTTITGMVKDAEGAALPGATVRAQGFSGVGTVTDMDGKYSLQVPEGATTLVFSFVGMQDKVEAINGRTVIDVVLQPQDIAVDEVVVTAIGVKKDAKKLGYSVQSVSAADVEKSTSENIVNSLNGKVAGVNINSSSGSAGSSAYIEIRGAASLTGNNQPLFVVDGVPINNGGGGTGSSVAGVDESNRAIDIDPNTIESINVLKGGAATALYGLRAANGVIIITTKKGKKGSANFQAHVKSSVTVSQVSQLPPLQNKYAQGSHYYAEFIRSFGLPASDVLSPDAEMYNGVSWGPALDSLRYTTDANYIPGNVYYGGGLTPMDEYLKKWDPNGRLVLATDPLAGSVTPTPYDRFEFFQTGMAYNNYADITGGTDVSSFFLSISNDNNESVIPNNTFDKTAIKYSGDFDFTSKFSGGIDLNYVVSGGNRIQRGSNISGVMLGLLRTPPTFDNSGAGLDPAAFADGKLGYEFADGTQRTYRHGTGYDNPYWIANNISYQDKVNRTIGNVHFNYKPLDWMSFTYRLGADVYGKAVKEYFAKNSNAYKQGYRNKYNEVNQELNSDLMMNINKDINEDLNINFMLGQNLYERKYNYTQGIANGLTEDKFYNLSNTSSILAYEGTYHKRTMAYYGSLDLAYKNFLYVGFTGRNEWSTTMPEDANNFFYPSANIGFVFSELLPKNDIFSFGKLRASYAIVANDGPAYATNTYYVTPGIGDGWTDGISWPFLGTSAFTYSGALGATSFRPEKMTSMEVGADLRFFNNRLSLDLAYFKQINEDLLLYVPIAATTGFTSQYQNAAKMHTTGIEAVLKATPVKTKSFNWDLIVNFSNPKTIVDELAPNVDNIFLGGFTEPQVRAVAGEVYRTIYATDWKRDANGNVVINDDPTAEFFGFPMMNDEMEAKGQIAPNFTVGITNSISFKGLTISALLDIKNGGLMWNGTKGALYFFGAHKDTENRGESKVWEGVLGHYDANGDLMHYDANGNEVAGPGDANSNSVVVDENWYWWDGQGSGFTGPSAPFIEKTDWVRLRNVSVSYDLNSAWFGKSFLKSAQIFFTGTNLFLKTPYTGIDPETSLLGNSNGQGFDYFNMPGTKSYQFGVKLGF